MGELRALVREVYDTVMAPTQPAQASPESMRTMSHPALRAHEPASGKANQVLKALNARGVQAKLEDVKRFISALDPQRALVLTADKIADAFTKKN